MKLKPVILFVVVFNFQFLFSQIVKTIPEYPTENDSIVVIFDAAQPGATELLNYTGTVYAHTGVTTHLGLWQHVIGTWGNNSVQPALTNEGSQLYKLTIGYPRTFYKLTDTSEHITALDFVFRSADGTKQTRPDIFIPLNSQGLNLILNSPTLPAQYSDPLSAPLFASQNDTLNLSATAITVGTSLKSLSLYINWNLKLQLSSNTITYSFISNNFPSGVNHVTVIASDNSGNIDSLAFAIVNNPAVQQAPPPAGVEYGINYDAAVPTSATLVLFAPRKSFVYVLGDFNNWEVNTSYMMNEYQVTPDSVIWWITLNNLSPGEEYAFQYLVDGNIRIADPYAHKILDPDNDKYINSSPSGNIVYPNLKSYPSGKTSEIVSVLQTGQSEYKWQDVNFKRPAKTDLVIYELLVRDFVSTHSYHTLIDTIAYLKRLGVNAIELLPVMEFEGNDSWGYNRNFDFAPDKYYGSQDSLKHFVDAAHQNGMAVILDAPMNDIMNSSPLARLYWDSTNNRPAADNPWLNPVATHPYNVGNDFNYSSSETKYYIHRFTRYWLTNYNVDGFRFDLAGGYTQAPNGYNNWQSSYDASRVANDKEIADSVWAVSPGAYIILEEFVTNAEEDTVANYGLMVWDNMAYAYQQAAMGYSSGSNLSGISYKEWQWNTAGLVGYMESHDEERLMYQCLNYGNSSGSYSIKDLATALNRVKMCSAFFYTVPGPKMLWQFGELGYDYSINFNGRTGDKPIRWDYLNDPQRMSLYKVTEALIKLKENYDVFRTDNFTTNLAGDIKSITLYSPSINVVVIGNFSVAPQTSSSGFPNTGTWYDYFTGEAVNIPSTGLTLSPGEFHIFTNSMLPVPDTSVVTGIDENNFSQIKTFGLYQNYPNPYNPSTTINFQIPKAGFVTLKVYDILGREVATLVNGNKPAGKYSVTFNGSKLSTGVYFYRLQSGSSISIKKMVILK